VIEAVDRVRPAPLVAPPPWKGQLAGGSAVDQVRPLVEDL
jgi:hypothetical protein